MSPKERFIELLTSTFRQGTGYLIDYLEKSDFFVAPASTKYHCAYEGGLLEHSLAVYDELERLVNCYQMGESIAPASRIIVALLHDLCKVGMYKPVEKFRKNEFGGWEKYQTYEHDEQYKFGGHGSKSVFVAAQLIQLLPEEAAAINCHMGTWDVKDVATVSQVYSVNPLAWLLHVADESATFILNK